MYKQLINKSQQISKSIRRTIKDSKYGEARTVFWIPGDDGQGTLRTIVSSNSVRLKWYTRDYPGCCIGEFTINSMPVDIEHKILEHCVKHVTNLKQVASR